MYGFGGLGHFLVQILKFIFDGGGAVLSATCVSGGTLPWLYRLTERWLQALSYPLDSYDY